MPRSKPVDKRCKILGISIKKLRESRGLTQETLSEKLDVHISYVGQIERGLKYPSLRVLFKIADALNVKPSELFAGINAKKKK